MDLRELERPAVEWHYEKWGRSVIFRSITAKQLVALRADYRTVDGLQLNSEQALDFYAELLALCCEDPQYTFDEWQEATFETLSALGEQALQVCGLIKYQATRDTGEDAEADERNDSPDPTTPAVGAS